MFIGIGHPYEKSIFLDEKSRFGRRGIESSSQVRIMPQKKSKSAHPCRGMHSPNIVSSVLAKLPNHCTDGATQSLQGATQPLYPWHRRSCSTIARSYPTIAPLALTELLNHCKEVPNHCIDVTDGATQLLQGAAQPLYR